MNELKPCPFCGGVAALSGNTYYIWCTDCGFRTGDYIIRDELLETWNTRPDPWTRIEEGRPETMPEDGEGTNKIRDMLNEDIKKLKAELAALKEQLEDNPVGKALDDLWQAIILKNKPDYGDWEYPGQAYRHLLAEYEALRDPWTRIEEGRPETLPNEYDWYNVSVVYEDGSTTSLPAYWVNHDWHENDYSGDLLLPNSGKVYAYQELPDPAPYKVDEEE